MLIPPLLHPCYKAEKQKPAGDDSACESFSGNDINDLGILS